MRDLSLRENLAIIAGQCAERLQEITQKDPEDAGTYAVIARSLFEAMAESVETRDPGRFLSSIETHRDATTECSGDLPDMIAVMEELVMEWKFDAEETRFLWALFRQARLKSTSTGRKISETAGQESTETLQALKKEIADRRQVETKLRESERRFRDIAEFTPQVIFEMDADYTVTFANKQAYEIYGYNPTDFKAGISAIDLIHPGEVPRVRKVLEEIARGKPSTGTEYTAIRKDGSLFPVIAHVARIMKGRTFTGWRGIIVDITQRKKAEEELIESKRKFRDIAELSPQVIFEQNADGIVTFANKRGLELFGYTGEDLQKGDIKAADLLPESERDTLRENLTKIIAGEKHTTGHEYTVQRKDGTTFPAIIYTTAFFRNDKLAGFRGVLLDITQLRNADTELRERERRFRDLAEFMPQVIFEMDEKGTITFANKQAFEIFGYDERDQSEGIEYLSLFSTEEIPILKTNLRKIAEGGQSAGNEYNAVRKDGSSFPVIIHVARIMKDGHLTGFRGMIVDITERKKAEEELRESKRFLQDIADRLPGVIYQFYVRADGEMGLSYISASSKELFGIDMETPQPFEKFLQGLTPSCKEGFLNSIKEAVAGESNWQFEGEFKKPFGRIISFAGTSRPARIGDTLRFNGMLLDITARKQIEEKLKESERKFRDIAELMPQVIFEIDDKGSVVFVNKQAFEFFGYKESDLPPHFNCFAHITPEDFPRMMANLRKVADGARSPGNEYTALKKDGSRFSVIIYVTRIMSDDRLTGYRGIIIDITERKKVEEELRRTHKELDDRNSFLNALLAAIPTPVFYKDAEGRYLGCNQAFTDQMGLASEEIEGRTAFDLWSAESAGILQREDRAMMETGKPRVYEKQITDRGGNERSVIFNKNVYRCADGTVAGIVGSYMDITQQKLARQSLEESEKMYRTFFDSTTDIVFLKDEKLHYVLANKVLLGFFGRKEQEVLGATDFTLMPPEAASNWRRTDYEALEAARVVVSKEKMGDKTYEVLKFPVEIARGKVGVGGFVRDITERTRAEEALTQSEQRLRQIIDLVPHFIFAKDIDGRFILANKAVADTYGTTVENLIGKDDAGFTPSDEQVKHFRSDDLDVMTNSRRKYIPEEPITDSRGNVRCLQTVKIPFTFSGTQTPAVLGVSVDITEHRKAERQVIESEQSLRAILAASPIGIGRVRDRVFEWANEAMCDITGYPIDELTGKRSRILYEDDAVYERIGEELYRDGQVETKWVKKDGEVRDILLQVSPADSHAYIYTASDITRLKLAEKALRESEERWQFALEGAGDGLWDWDALTGKVYFSRQWKEMLGFAEDEIGDSLGEWDRRIHPDDRDGVYAKLHRHLKGTSSVYISQHRLQCKNGTYKWILDRGKVITRTGDGKPMRAIGTHTDITGHKKTEERLRLDESRTEALLKINQMANRPLPDITGFTLEESIRLTGSTLGYLAFLNDDESVLTMHSWSRKAMEDCMIGNKPINYPLETTGIWGDPVRLRRPVITNDYDAPDIARKGFPEGHVKVKRHLGVPVFDGERIVAIVGVGNKQEGYTETDINQVTLMAQGMVRLLKQKTAQEALSISEARLRAILDSAKDTIFIKDRDLRYVVVNRAMSELFGIPVEKIVGGSDRDLFPPNTVEHIGQIDSRVLQGETIEEELARPIRDMNIIFHTIKAPLRNGAGEITGLCGIARDVTERKHLESQLLQSQKMEAVGTLAGGVAHDFNNLLSAIMGYASLLQMKMDKDNPLFGYASHILTSSEKAATLTQSLLAFSRKQVINLRPVVINDTIEKVHRLLERLVPEDVEFRIEKSSERLIAMADPGQLDQVIMNLVTNARDAMPRGGKLTITIEHVRVGSDFIATRGYGEQGEYAVIAVSDTGIGMDRKTVEKIFEPFFTTKGVGRGTGLGLAIVYGIIKQHNGYIDVRSQPGEGSVFSVYLPLVWLEPADEEAPARISGGTETILIAEDNTELCKLSVSVLEDHGYTVLAATDGSMAVETFREHKGAISLVILDVVMPKMNGKEAFDAIRKLDPSIKVIYTSGYTDDIIQEKGVANEKYDFLGKPITPATLLKKIREVLDRQ
ncbi:MAG: PAS domain S-box protein [Syntrophorhabdaceae bacterium]|nr:PAS domain S-box protein [Syntrophorhabdaceae bacterium]